MSSKKIQTISSSLGDRIRLVREGAGLTQEALADRLQMTSASVNRYEKGHRVPDAGFLDRLVSVIPCDPGWLLTGVATGVGIAAEPAMVYGEPVELLPGSVWGGVEVQIKKAKALVVQALHGLQVSIDDSRLALIMEYVFIHRLDFAQVVDLLRLLKLTGAIGAGSQKPDEKP